jgi:hypothetical protein
MCARRTAESSSAAPAGRARTAPARRLSRSENRRTPRASAPRARRRGRRSRTKSGQREAEARYRQNSLHAWSTPSVRRRARYNRDAGLVKQSFGDLDRRAAEPAHVGPRVERALGHGASDARDLREHADHPAAAFLPRAPQRDGGFARRLAERARRSRLHERVWARDEMLLEDDHRLDEPRRTEHEANAPSAHREGLRQSDHGQRPVAHPW